MTSGVGQSKVQVFKMRNKMATSKAKDMEHGKEQIAMKTPPIISTLTSKWTSGTAIMHSSATETRSSVCISSMAAATRRWEPSGATSI